MNPSNLSDFSDLSVLSNQALGIVETSDGIVVSIHVQPRAKRNEITGMHGNRLKVRLTAPPVDGSANKACSEFFAACLGISPSKVRVVKGEHSRSKEVKILHVSRKRFLAAIQDLISP